MQEDVQRWFDRRTSRASDWKTSRLVDVKGDTTVSVVPPALNEQDTGGAIVAASDPEAEHEEMVLKAQAVLAAVGGSITSELTPAAPDR